MLTSLQQLKSPAVFCIPPPTSKIGSHGLHVATALESSHTRERDAKHWSVVEEAVTQVTLVIRIFAQLSVTLIRSCLQFLFQGPKKLNGTPNDGISD